MKKLVSLFLAALLALTLAGCQSKGTKAASGASKAETSIERIKKAGKIVVGTEATYPPFESADSKDGKTIVGFDMDISQAIADKLGVKLEIKNMAFGSLEEAVKTGMINFTAAGMNPTPDREKVVDFSQIYFNTKQVLVVKDGNNSINSINDLKGKTLGVQLGTTSEAAAKTVPGVKQVKSLDKVDELMLEVKNGRLDGVVVENVVAGSYMKVGGLKMVEIPELNKDGELGIAIAVKKGDAELLKVVNDTINEMRSNGQYDKLLEKWGMTK